MTINRSASEPVPSSSQRKTRNFKPLLLCAMFALIALAILGASIGGINRAFAAPASSHTAAQETCAPDEATIWEFDDNQPFCLMTSDKMNFVHLVKIEVGNAVRATVQTEQGQDEIGPGQSKDYGSAGVSATVETFAVPTTR